MNLKWKRDYGDHQETDDLVLWVNGKPTDNVVSGWSGCYWAFSGNRKIGVFEKSSDAKECLLNELGL